MVIVCLRLSDVSVISPIVNPHPACPKNLGIRSMYGLCWPEKWLWIDSNGKNGNKRLLWKWIFGNLICNHCRVMAAWSRKTIKILEKFLRFSGKKRPLMVQFYKILFRKFSSRQLSTSCVQICEIWPTGNRWNCALLIWQKKTKFCLALMAVATARIAPKICQSQPQQRTVSALNFI